MADIDLNLLVAFLAIYEERSVTGAAKRVFLGQPAMSAALGRLRSLFDDDLFVRIGRTMQPTRKAEAIAPDIRDILDRVEGVFRASQTFDPATTQCDIAIAGSDYSSVVIVPKLLAYCATAAPGLNVRLVSYEKDNVGPLLDSGAVEVAFGVFAEPPRQTDIEPLFEEHLVGIVRKGHPALTDNTMSVETFATLSHALHTTRRDAVGYGDTVLERYGLTRRVAVTTPYMLVTPAIVAATDLVAMVPSRVAEKCLDRGAIEVFELPFASELWSISMVWSRLASADPLNRWLRDALRTICQEL
ncbi:MAG: LysR family transcriptional regulator [Cyanobacteria bacterium J06639_1]